MKRSRLQSVAASSLLLLGLCAAAEAGSRPRYGGTARVLLHDRVNSLDPATEDDHPASRDRMAALVFETLTSVDRQGRVHPRLASAWTPDAARRVWRFYLRLATFHDGSQLTAADAASVLSKNQYGWKVTAGDRQTVVIEAPAPVVHMPEMLAQPRFAVVKHLPDNAIAGTGPYKLREWQPAERAAFTANEDYWGGRPYPDAIEFQMGATLRDELLQRQLSPASAAELGLDQMRALDTSNQSIALSSASDLMVLLFLQPESGGKPGRKPVDPRVREALSKAINRAAISNVILQKHGLAASGLLPQWLTGYEFLFPGGTNLDRARELRAEAAGLIIISPIALAYDFSDPVAKLAAERIAVDAREAGLTVQPYGESHINSRNARASINADAVLLRIPLASLEPSVALASLAEDLGLSLDLSVAALGAARPEDLFEVESKALADFRVVPVSHSSQALWLNNGVHNWVQLPNGVWDLDQLWVEGAR
ncbi:MAG TPA: ABC transporter substrate-binding protein [Candidatus Angelobacter sp.]